MRLLLMLLAVAVPEIVTPQTLAELKTMRPYECMATCVSKGQRSNTCPDLATCENQCRSVCYPEGEELLDSLWAGLLAPRDAGVPRYRYLTVYLGATDAWGAMGFREKFTVTAWRIDDSEYENGPPIVFKGPNHFLSFLGSMGWELFNIGSNGMVMIFRQPYFDAGEK